MESKVCIFVIFVISAQSCFADQQNPNKLSEVDSATYEEIELKQREVIETKHKTAFGNVYTILNIYVNALISGQTFESIDVSLLTEEATEDGKRSIYLALEAFMIATGKSCSALEAAKYVTNVEIEIVYAAAGDAITLASSGNYAENQVEIENLEARSKLHFEIMLDTVFNSFLSCLGSTDKHTLTAVNNARRAATNSLNGVVSQIFHAIRVLGEAVTDGTADESTLQKIHDSQNAANTGLTKEVGHIFGLLKAIFAKINLASQHE